MLGICELCKSLIGENGIGKRKGTCRIYVYAQNGAVKIVTVKVK